MTREEERRILGTVCRMHMHAHMQNTRYDIHTKQDKECHSEPQRNNARTRPRRAPSAAAWRASSRPHANTPCAPTAHVA